MSETERPLVTDSASPKQIREARKRSRFTKRKRLDAWRNVIATVDGQRVLREILDFTGLYRQGYIVGDQAQYRDGVQNVGAFVIAMSEEAQPNALELMRVQRQKDLKNAS